MYLLGTTNFFILYTLIKLFSLSLLLEQLNQEEQLEELLNLIIELKRFCPC